jgi:hypothetical protein
MFLNYIKFRLCNALRQLTEKKKAQFYNMHVLYGIESNITSGSQRELSTQWLDGCRSSGMGSC